MSQPPPPRLPSSPNELTDPLLNAYIENFLEIADFRAIDNGKALLELIRLSPDHPKLKPAIRKVVGLFGCQAPAGRVCALQFLKEALEAGSFFTAECLEKSVLANFTEIIQYRAPVRSIQRGSTYFCREFDKNVSDEEMINLVKLSSTFFRMVHECLYVWGALYFPGSAFDRLRLKMEKKVTFPEFPKEFKFYSETKVNNFKERCGDLIRKVEERSLSGSVERKAESMGKEKERNGSNSPRSIKKTKQPIKQQPSKLVKESAKETVSLPPKQQTRAANEQSIKDQQQIDKQQENAAQDNPPSSKRTKRHKPKKNKSAKKQFIENIKEETDKISENNSSKLRKKNSFIEVPFNLEKQNPLQSHSQSAELHQSNKASSRDLPQKATAPIRAIQQHEESDGGRYSMDDKESEISQIMYQYNKREAQSPRSQYSLRDRQAKGHMSIKRENSQQLQPSIAARGIDTAKQVKPITKQLQAQKSQPKQQQQNQVIVEDINQASPAKKQHSFKLPLNQLKGRTEVAPQSSKHSTSERRRQDKERKSTARKKFVSSEEQSMKEHRQEQTKQQTPSVVKNFHENSSLEYESNARNEVKMTKHQSRVAQQRQQISEAPALPLKPKQPQNQKAKETTMQPPMPVKSSKPIKLKSNSNLKTVFESAGYKVVQALSKNGGNANKQQKQPLQPTLASVSKNSSNAPQMPPVAKQAKKASIFETVQADTIETINELTPLTRKPDTKPSSPAKVYLDEAPEQPNSKVTICREYMPQMPKGSQEVTHRQSKTPHRDQRSISLQNRPQRKEAQEEHIQHHQNQATLHNSRKSEEEHHSIQVYQQQLRPIRRNTTLSSRFRHFKEINLFIQPKSPLPASPSEPLMPPQLHSGLDQKVNIIEELNKIRTVIKQREDNLNLTLMSLRSEMPDRKSSEQTKIEAGTQTKLRHKSKGKFERKNKYRLFDDLSRSEENAFLLNLPPALPKDGPQSSKPAQMLPAALPRKPSAVKQQLKPNTLLYALYKRKYSNV